MPVGVRWNCLTLCQILVPVDLLDQTIKVLHSFSELLCLLSLVGDILLPETPRTDQGSCGLLYVLRGEESGAVPLQAHLQEVSRLLGELGADVLKVLLVELAVKVAGHFLLIEGSVLAERTHKLDPATGGK